jgi:drug/metabolite transporter (DMT)-like permease
MGVWGTYLACIIGKWMGWIKINKTVTWKFWCMSMLPVGVFHGVSLSAGNAVYLYLSVSFAQMLKALTPLYILLIYYITNVQKPTSKIVLSVAVITFGTMITSVGELKFSMIGFLIQSTADILTASRLVLVQSLLSKHDFSAFETLYYLGPATSLCQLVLAFTYEREAFTNPIYLEKASEMLYVFILGIIAGTSINFVQIFIIKYTSGLNLKLLSVFRNNSLVVFSVLFLGDKTTPLQMLGYCISLGAFMWYTTLSNEKKVKERPSHVVAKENPYEMVPLHDNSDMNPELVSKV